MKKIFLSVILILLLFVGCTSIQIGDPVTVEPLQHIIDIPNVTADELYIKANQWAVSAFNSAESVIEFSDKENGIVTGKYVTSYITNAFFGYKLKVTTIITIETKDEKVRVTMTPRSMEQLLSNGQPNYAYPITQDDSDKINATWISLIADLTTNLLAESTDW